MSDVFKNRLDEIKGKLPELNKQKEEIKQRELGVDSQISTLEKEKDQIEEYLGISTKPTEQEKPEIKLERPVVKKEEENSVENLMTMPIPEKEFNFTKPVKPVKPLTPEQYSQIKNPNPQIQTKPPQQRAGLGNSQQPYQQPQPVQPQYSSVPIPKKEIPRYPEAQAPVPTQKENIFFMIRKGLVWILVGAAIMFFIYPYLT